MGRTSLGSVLDRRALDAATGARARLRVDVPAAWLAEGADLAVTAPARLACARCDGGGCDTCARSGAFHTPADVDGRVVFARLPPASPRGVALRIPHPFGASHDIEQLLLEIEPSATPSSCVSRLNPAPLARLASNERIAWPVLAAAVLAAILFALFSR